MIGEKEIRFIDLFGGVGGFRLGLERANNISKEKEERIWKDDEEGLREKEGGFDNEEDKGLGCSPTEGKQHPKWCPNRQFNNKCTHIGEESELEERRQGRKWTSDEQGEMFCIRQKPTFRCVWYNDFDRYAVQTYNKNFNESYKATDIRTVEADSIPDFDMLCAGFPCQAFSIAGKRKGFEDTRGTLFFEISRILEAKRPKLVLLENVKGLLNHGKGQTFRVVIQTLSELGYDVQWMVLNSKFFGVPQNRERVFIVGHLRGEGGFQIFPFGESYGMDTEAEGEEEIMRTLRANYFKHQEPFIRIVQDSGKEMARIYDPIGIAPTLKGKSGGWQEPKILYEINSDKKDFRVVSDDGIASSIQARSDTHKIVMPVLTPDREKKRQHGRRFKENGDPSFTLTGLDIHGIMLNQKIRRLTPMECERLQGFPDNWTAGVSDTQRYRQMGNAVTVNVIEAIGRKISKEFA